ncbi:hypothetical protein [Nostoc sp. 'Peltigera membranacea cyanobiont' 232]|uniref:hypothetical protein n=1 Tax=Nostoc sp. 'Peltigera membranacea cyanobiont' 232 TaxID=2014531 RepID=UPI000B9529F8|nr:hypothetical protein [Nostoc sp. 'Peltigera membranacea cyanobiont' 232]OYE01442.1 hypothetical protein CDG79_29640 [Nostoc sp. 'Peltigera membranacea cyanobiont' 232]
MDMQSLLTLAIVAIFWAFVTLVIFQFINGLFVSAAYASNVVSVSNGNIAASTIPSVSEVITPQAMTFEKLPDPWTLEDEAVHRTSNEAVILSFPTLRLLPPVKEISSQPKRTTRSNKANNSANKSPKNKKADVNSSGKRKPGRPRKTA